MPPPAQQRPDVYWERPPSGDVFTSAKLHRMRVAQDIVHDLAAMRVEISRALEFMDSAHGRVLTIAAIAAAAELSPRRLQELVRAAMAETPMSLLRRIRMLHARQVLLDPTEERSIAEIARDAQLLHLGRFSVRYAAEFGESPSDTVRRVRTRQSEPPRAQTHRTVDVPLVE